MDPIGVFIATLHQLIGHDTTARFLGQPVGDKKVCIMCRFERGAATKQDVVAAIGTSHS